MKIHNLGPGTWTKFAIDNAPDDAQKEEGFFEINGDKYFCNVFMEEGVDFCIDTDTGKVDVVDKLEHLIL